eukprot:1460170-Rhodomonas_salina.1
MSVCRGLVPLGSVPLPREASPRTRLRALACETRSGVQASGRMHSLGRGGSEGGEGGEGKRREMLRRGSSASSAKSEASDLKSSLPAPRSSHARLAGRHGDGLCVHQQLRLHSKIKFKKPHFQYKVYEECGRASNGAFETIGVSLFGVASWAYSPLMRHSSRKWAVNTLALPLRAHLSPSSQASIPGIQPVSISDSQTLWHVLSSEHVTGPPPPPPPQPSPARPHTPLSHCRPPPFTHAAVHGGPTCRGRTHVFPSRTLRPSARTHTIRRDTLKALHIRFADALTQARHALSCFPANTQSLLQASLATRVAVGGPLAARVALRLSDWLCASGLRLAAAQARHGGPWTSLRESHASKASMAAWACSQSRSPCLRILQCEIKHTKTENRYELYQERAFDFGVYDLTGSPPSFVLPASPR